jgi:hypothetical protein
LTVFRSTDTYGEKAEITLLLTSVTFFFGGKNWKGERQKRGLELKRKKRVKQKKKRGRG